MDDQKRSPLERPIIILGSPRSGTTLLGAVLSEHKDLCYVEEPRFTWKIGNEKKSDVLQPKDAGPEVVRGIRKKFEKMVARSGASRLLEKHPSNSLRPEFVSAVFPDAIFVHIYRDPVETILSIRDLWTQKAHGFKQIKRSDFQRRLRELTLRQIPALSLEMLKRLMPSRPGETPTALWGPRLPGMSEMVRDFGLLETCFLQWRFCYESINAFGKLLPAEKFREIALESLDSCQLESLFDFLQLEPSRPVMDTFKARYASKKTHSRLEKADPAEVKRIKTLIASTINWNED